MAVDPTPVRSRPALVIGTDVFFNFTGCPHQKAEMFMPKVYWVATYRSIKNPDALAAYAKTAAPAIQSSGGRFLVRGNPDIRSGDEPASSRDRVQQRRTGGCSARQQRLPHSRRSGMVPSGISALWKAPRRRRPATATASCDCIRRQAEGSVAQRAVNMIKGCSR